MSTKSKLVIEAPLLRLDPEKSLQGIDWEQAFGNSQPVEIEIGIGKGRFIQAAAIAHPGRNFLGVEWANQYLRIGEARANKKGLKNIRFLRVDAKELLTTGIPAASVQSIYIFYPDPWPKKRHHKRRLIERSTVSLLARALKKNGTLHIATDHEPYWKVIEPLVDSEPQFQRLPEFGGKDFPLPVDQPLTNFEAKYLVEGRKRNRGSWIKNLD